MKKTYRTKTVRQTVRLMVLAEGKAAVAVSSPAIAESVLRPVFQQLDGDREHFVILALNAQNHFTGYKVVSTGGTSGTLVDPKTLFRDALYLGASSLVLAHNHPSGDPTPSQEDIRLTRQLVEGGKLLDIRIHDSIVLGEGRIVSLAERGQLGAR